jgi:hypothetical protein
LKNSVTALTQRKDLLTLGILIVITVAVRLPGVFNRAIWYDESITLLETAGNAIPQWSPSPTTASTQKQLLVGSPTLREITAGLRQTDVHPPVYYGLLSLWRRIAGGSLETARLFSVISSTATVILFYLLLRISGSRFPMVPSLVYSLTSGAVHYSHEARNYSLALFFIFSASMFAYLAIIYVNRHQQFFWIFSFMMSLFLGLSFLTNYLSIFPLLFLLLWYVLWLPKTHRVLSVPFMLMALGISLLGLSTLAAQLGARPNQFQREIPFVQELGKIIKFNFEMIWNPITSNIGVRIALGAAVFTLAMTGFSYVRNSWHTVDKRLFTMMTGLAIVPSAGVLLLDLAFSKSLGKSSYVFFAGPAVVYLLTLAINDRTDRGAHGSSRATVSFGHTVAVVVPFFIGLQLTGINFDLERTPGFAGSTLRSLARRIDSSSPTPMVVIGAGHGRGDPASLIYELRPDTMVCVLERGSDVSILSSQLTDFADIWIVFARGRVTAAVEASLVESLTSGGNYRVTSKSVRFAHLTRPPRPHKLG